MSSVCPESEDILARVFSFFTPQANASSWVGEKILVALSGGADSTFLLTVLTDLAPDLSLSLAAAYVDHGLRSREEIDPEIEHCEGLAARLGVGFSVLPIGVRCSLQDVKGNRQERARQLRYRALEEEADRLGARYIATGHTSDDQVETVLMRLIRGAGPGGLGGIPARRGWIIRPILSISRKEVESFLAERGEKYMTDRSNFSTAYQRNRIRGIVPLLEAESPAIRETVARTARLLSDEDFFIEGIVSDWMEKHAKPGHGTLDMAENNFDAQPLVIRRRIFRRCHSILSGRSIYLDQIETAMEGLEGTGNATLPGGIAVRRQYERIGFFSRRTAPLPERELPVPGRLEFLPGLSIAADFFTCPADGHPATSREEILLDPARLAGPLRVRVRKPGDFFHPSGMGGKRKKIQDYFMDRKIPVWVRDRIPIVTAGDEIVWIAGYRQDERHCIGPDSASAGKQLIRLRAIMPSSAPPGEPRG